MPVSFASSLNSSPILRSSLTGTALFIEHLHYALRVELLPVVVPAEGNAVGIDAFIEPEPIEILPSGAELFRKRAATIPSANAAPRKIAGLRRAKASVSRIIALRSFRSTYLATFSIWLADVPV